MTWSEVGVSYRDLLAMTVRDLYALLESLAPPDEAVPADESLVV